MTIPFSKGASLDTGSVANVHGNSLKPIPNIKPITFLASFPVTPINRYSVLSGLIFLAFIPLIRMNYGTEPTPLVSFLQSMPQIAMITLAMTVVVSLKVFFRWQDISAICAAACMGLSQLAGLLHSPASQKNFIMPSVFILLLLTGPVVASLAANIDATSSGEYIAKLVKTLLAIMSFECVTRFALSPLTSSRVNMNTFGSATVNDDWFYRYKQSIIYSDSNSVGMALLCLIALLLVFRGYFRRHHLLLAYFLVLATFSRASIVAAAAQYAIYRFWHWRRWIVRGMVLLSPMALYGLVRWYINSDQSIQNSVDASFLSKLYILQTMADIYRRADLLQRLFGIGSGNTIYIAGMAAHDIIAVWVLEFGFLGSAIFIVYVWLMARKSPLALYLLIVPMLINGFSLFLTTIPFFYVTLGLLGNLRSGELSTHVSGRSF